MEIIDLCSSDEDDENVPVQHLASGLATGKRKTPPAEEEDNKRSFAQQQDDQLDDSDVEEVEPPHKQPTNGAGSSAAAAEEFEEDEEVAFVGRTGALALADFPHARENCAAMKFTAGEEHKHCPNCFCFCCECALPGLDLSGLVEHTSACLTSRPRPLLATSAKPSSPP